MGDVYVDNTNSSGNLTGADWDFTKDSTTVTEASAGGNALAELSAGDYVRNNGGTQWYKVTSVTDDDNFEITPAFQQDTDEGVNCNYNNEDGSADDPFTGANAFVHPAQATTDTVRTAGDTIYLKAGQTHQLGGLDLVADEDGTAASLITLFGCDSVTDPWSDADDTHVTFDFNDTANYVYQYSDRYWQFENIDFIQSGGSNGALFIGRSEAKVIDCVCRDSAGKGLYVYQSNGIEIQESSFYGNISSGLTAINSFVELDSCTFNGGVATQDYGLYIVGSFVKMEDTTFGVITAHDVASIIFWQYVCEVEARRCKFDDAIELSVQDRAIISYLKSEDHDQVVGAHKAWYWNGTIDRDTAEADLVGGSSTDIKVTPNSNCTTNYPILCMEWEEQVVAAQQQTRGVAIKVTTNPGSYPTASELYLEAEYYDHAVNDTVATVVSTATLSANDTWTWFPVTFTPAQVQKVRYRVYLGTQENAESYHIDNALYDTDPT